MSIDQALLDSLWDYSDPIGSEARLRSAGDDPELATQVARALGLQARYEEAIAILDGLAEASTADGAVALRVRVRLERGRVLNSSGTPLDAVPLFAAAADLAESAGLDFLAIDAVHMLAIADPARSEEHAVRGLSLVERTRDQRSKRWAVSIHNNLGWSRFDAGLPEEALREFRIAYESAIAWGTDDQRFYSRWAIARTLRQLGVIDEARALQDALLAERPTDEDVLGELRILAAL